MRFYENLSPLDRRRLVLGAVAFDVAMEGMIESRDQCLAELLELDRQAAALSTPSTDPAE